MKFKELLENKINESKKIDDLFDFDYWDNQRMPIKDAVKELQNLSSEKLDMDEFFEYLEDYILNSKSYKIDTTGDYYWAITSAYDDYNDKRNKYYKEYIK